MPVTINLTKQRINALPAPPLGKRTYYYDKQVKGLQLVTYGSGQKSFVVYKKIDGKPTRYKLGNFPDLSVEMARKEAYKTLGDIATGNNPQLQKRTERAKTVTLADAFVLLLETRKSLKPKTRYDYERLLEVAFKDWKTKRLVNINKEMVLKRHEKLGRENGHNYANLAMRFLRSVFNFAIAHFEDDKGVSLIQSNPVQYLSKVKAWYPTQRRDNVIESHELAALLNAIDNLKNENEANAITVADYLITLLLTGLRREETAKLTWENIDLNACIIRIPETKNNEIHKLPIPDYLHTILTNRKIASTSDFVFPGTGIKGYLNDPRRKLKKVIETSNITFTLHDLRRTFATIAENLDISAYALKRLLNHKMKNDVTAGYIVSDVERLRNPMQRIENYILISAHRKNNVVALDRTGTAS